jgi:hypothetical protein
MRNRALYLTAPLLEVVASTKTLVLELTGAMNDGPRDEVLVVLEITTEEEALAAFTTSSLLCVTIQYDCQSHGEPSSPTEGFHSWNCSGVTVSSQRSVSI